MGRILLALGLRETLTAQIRLDIRLQKMPCLQWRVGDLYCSDSNAIAALCVPSAVHHYAGDDELLQTNLNPASLFDRLVHI